MLMRAYHDLNPTQMVIFVVPTIVLVDQQAKSIEKNTGLKALRLSGEHKEEPAPWRSEFVCVCTPAMIVQAIDFKELLVSQISLIIFDEVHEAINENSNYGKIVSKLSSATSVQRPRILGLTASPSGTNKTNITEIVQKLCSLLYALPYAPDNYNDDIGKDVKRNYVEIEHKSFEIKFEQLVFDMIQMLAKLDPFFEKNIVKIHPNISSTQKVDSIVSHVNEARYHATQTNDMMLLQLSAFMKKWIDALDLLKIFGPKRTLEDIQFDLDHMCTNENFKVITTLCQGILTSARNGIRSLNSQCSPNESSTRVSKLLHEISKYKNNDTRILVFVERRFTAERLCRSLAEHEDTRELNPSYLIGNTAGDFPRELQQEVLKKFRNGESKLLVATSVAEQGMDVASCGVVVCFDGIKSLKSIIQSRGRARQNLANFTVFVQSGKSCNVLELSNLETTMNYAVKLLMMRMNSTFEPSIENEIQKFLNSSENEDDNELELDDDDDSDVEEESVALSFYDYNKKRNMRKVLADLKMKFLNKVKISQKQQTFTAKFKIDAASEQDSWLSETLMVSLIRLIS